MGENGMGGWVKMEWNGMCRPENIIIINNNNNNNNNALIQNTSFDTAETTIRCVQSI